MNIGLYINGNLRYRSTNFEKCAENAFDFLYSERLKHKEVDFSSSMEYIHAVDEITIIKDNVSQTTYKGNTLVIKPIEKKKYLVCYAVEFEESADLTDEDFISSEIKYICMEDKLVKIYTRLRNYLEINIQKGFKSFDEMLGDEIECLQDTNETYEIYDKEKRAFHIITITELK